MKAQFRKRAQSTVSPPSVHFGGLSCEPVEIVGDVQSPGDVIDVIKRGLNVGAIERLRDELGIPSSRLLRTVGMTDSTFRRRQATGRLDRNESERVYRLGSSGYASAIFRGGSIFRGNDNRLRTHRGTGGGT